jgi:hypothetical protein
LFNNTSPTLAISVTRFNSLPSIAITGASVVSSSPKLFNSSLNELPNPPSVAIKSATSFKFSNKFLNTIDKSPALSAEAPPNVFANPFSNASKITAEPSASSANLFNCVLVNPSSFSNIWNTGIPLEAN